MPRHFCQREIPFLAQLPQVRADRVGVRILRRMRSPFAPQKLDNRGGIQPAYFTQKPGALQQLHIGSAVKPVFALAAMRAGESKIFPGAYDRRRDSHLSRYVPDLQVSVCAGRTHTSPLRLGIPAPEGTFFLLDSSLTRSLTLRDYSKVVAGHKR